MKGIFTLSPTVYDITNSFFIYPFVQMIDQLFVCLIRHCLAGVTLYLLRFGNLPFAKKLSNEAKNTSS